jgi:hypothetical protein
LNKKLSSGEVPKEYHKGIYFEINNLSRILELKKLELELDEYRT